MQEEQRQTLAMRVSIRTIFLNLALAVMKLAAGLIAHSGALLSDAANSASDVVSTMVVMLGVRIAGKESDSE
ncbi:MAG: cation transporter, partial [Oscillospiraceae bacterium]